MNVVVVVYHLSSCYDKKYLVPTWNNIQ